MNDRPVTGLPRFLRSNAFTCYDLQRFGIDPLSDPAPTLAPPVGPSAQTS
ncbi:MAG TPA: hypothetical protein VG226_07050 [Acidimicrobiales bacterium]|nr:hypothetical protein [Acidimicrobiales bacterium]